MLVVIITKMSFDLHLLCVLAKPDLPSQETPMGQSEPSEGILEFLRMPVEDPDLVLFLSLGL